MKIGSERPALRSNVHYYDSIYSDGAVSLPSAVRQFLGVEEGGPLHFVVDSGLGVVRVEKNPLCCSICGRGRELAAVNSHFVCKTCVEELLAHPPRSFALE